MGATLTWLWSDGRQCESGIGEAAARLHRRVDGSGARPAGGGPRRLGREAGSAAARKGGWQRMTVREGDTGKVTGEGRLLPLRSGLAARLRR